MVRGLEIHSAGRSDHAYMCCDSSAVQAYSPSDRQVQSTAQAAVHELFSHVMLSHGGGRAWQGVEFTPPLWRKSLAPSKEPRRTQL